MRAQTEYSDLAQSLIYLFCIFVYLNNKCIFNKLMEINVFELLTLFFVSEGSLI